MAKERDPFVPETGLLEEATAKTTDAYFEGPDEYGRIFLKLEVAGEDLDGGEDVWRYSTGKGYLVLGDGASVKHESGKEGKTFHINSGVGQLLAAGTKAGVKWREHGSTPLDASTFRGLNCEWELVSEDFEMEDDDGAKSVKTRRLMLPVAVVAAKAPARKASAVKAEVSDELPAKLRGQLIALAKSCETWQDFFEKAFTEVEGVEGNVAAEEAVSDPDGLYAQAHS